MPASLSALADLNHPSWVFLRNPARADLFLYKKAVVDKVINRGDSRQQIPESGKEKNATFALP